MKILIFANSQWFISQFLSPLVMELRNKGYEIILLSPRDNTDTELERNGFRWIKAPLKRNSLNPIREVFFVAWLSILLRRERFDCVHSFTLKCCIYGSIAARVTGTPRMVNSITGLGYAFTNNGFFTKILKNFILFLMKISFRKNNTKLLTLNNADFNYLLKENVVESNQISVTHGTGIDCVKYSPNTRLQQDTFTVLMASRLLWDKGIKEFVEAAEIISEDNPQIRFLLAGAPDHQNPASASMSWVSDVKREGRVELLGHIADMPTLLKVADVVVLPSYREGLPTILLEAAACGIPAITTDVPGCSDAVLDGETGLVVGVKNAAELARAIMHLHENRRLHASMGTAARARSLSLYEVKVVADQISQHYLS